MIDWRAASSAETLQTIGQRMAEAVRHRGPDGSGLWTDAESGIVLGQRRLAIIDLTSGGAQPMHSADGRYVIVCNGEIYNYHDIARDLAAAGRFMRSASDVEALVEACALWGVREAVERAIGMFAFVLWDRRTRTIFLARDRLGKKPLYYAQAPDRLLFASELKALRQVPGWNPSIDTDALAGYLHYGYVAQPHTIYREARKLPPGSILTLQAGREPACTQFWNLREVARAAQARNDPAPDEREAIESLDALLRDAVRLRMIADVPLGAFLSGGIDSSTVVALMQAQSTRPVKTFSIGFHEARFDEAQCARAVAGHLGTDHVEFYVTPQDALDVIPRLPDWFDEPFADPSQIPTYLVSELTRRHVTVALSGDGGDELFAGYERYLWTARLASTLSLAPRPIRRAVVGAMRALSPAAWDRVARIVPAPWRPPQPGDKLHKLADLLGSDPDADAIYRRFVTQWEQPEQIAMRGSEPESVLRDPKVAREFPDLVSRLQFFDEVTYLPDDILVKVDRATMAVALEGRAPLLDHRVVEFSWRLPAHFKLRHGKGKWLLRQVLDRYVPRRLVERPKMGFGVPIGPWLRGPLRDWAESLLSPQALSADGLLRPEPILTAWREHLEGSRNWQFPLWTILMLQAWRQRWA